MIEIIDINNEKKTNVVLSLQLLSYKVEAEIIDYFDLPPLKDTIETLKNCGEIFIGYYEKSELCGVISLKVEQKIVDIHRLIVHPNHFKKGIAQLLFNYVIHEFEANQIKVATGSKNIPAINFYLKNGFNKTNEVVVNEKLSLTFFEKIM